MDKKSTPAIAWTKKSDNKQKNNDVRDTQPKIGKSAKTLILVFFTNVEMKTPIIENAHKTTNP